MNARALLKEGIIWKIGKGDHIFFQFDNWIENRPLVDILVIEGTNIPNTELRVGEFITHEAQWDSLSLCTALNNSPPLYIK